MRWNLVLAALAASWGFVSVIVAGVALSGYGLVFWRCLLAAASLALFLVAVGGAGVLRAGRERVRIVAVGLVLATHWVLFFETVKRASVAVAILTVYTAPVFVALIAPLVLREPRSRVGLAALAVSAPGLALIALSGDGDTSTSALGVLLGLGAALTYAFLIVGIKTVTETVSPFVLSFWMYVVVSASLAPFVLAGGRALPHAGEWPYVVLLGVALTGATGALYVWLLRHVTAQAAGLLAYLEPVSASLLAWAILDQALGWEVVVGGLAVLAGGALVVLYEAADPGAVEAPAPVKRGRAALRMGG